MGSGSQITGGKDCETVNEMQAKMRPVILLYTRCYNATIQNTGDDVKGSTYLWLLTFLGAA
jgi:hypothetical protein